MGGVRGDVLELSKRLISIESHLHAAAREAAVGLFLAEWFRERGIEVEMQPVLDGRANVIARLPGGDGPSLMLCGHLDTVPAGDMAGAFDPRVDGNLLWGRGACDMKGAVAAMVCVLAETKRAQDERGASLLPTRAPVSPGSRSSGEARTAAVPRKAYPRCRTRRGSYGRSRRSCVRGLRRARTSFSDARR
jgi:arginine utilization protein RocB